MIQTPESDEFFRSRTYEQDQMLAFVRNMEREKNRLKMKLEEILKEHSRPHESENVYATNVSLLLDEVAKELKNK